MNKCDVAEYARLFSSGCVLHGIGQREITGIESLKQFILSIHNAFPDIKYTLEDIVADEDRVAWRYLAQGTHIGRSMGISPTAKKVTVNGMIINRFIDGKIAEHWQIFDRLDMFQQIGFLPPIR